ncbi:hypothetical protein RHGRI_005701 [Rhododendron griersonianum]|uniref:Reverse transcriptase domain-containing protein n=1 Tax=Rhododendron griersonianum TaxID=479676 RepID=A0AAV6LE57_9ERIC|nr:hypothetical protein RHGRI_005701 [Rhododendron griersonianum]
MNDIMCSAEKKGGVVRPAWSLKGFQNFINDCGLVDLGFSGYPFTWHNNRSGIDSVQERLDRVLATPSWCLSFAQASVTHLDTVGSDHNAIHLKLRDHARGFRIPFRFDARWVEDEEARHVINQAWATPIQGSRSFLVFKKIQACRSSLTNWKRRKRDNSGKSIAELKAKIFSLSNSWPGPPLAVIHDLKWQLKKEWDKEEMFWKQKSRVTWLNNGDKNTKFFHASVMRRRACNRISGIEVDNGNWTNSEILFALKGMGPTKAPGVDGMTPLFFQSYWPTVGDDVIAAVKSFFHSSNMLRSVNQTLITVIPKVKCPTKPSQFRPISLCTVSYKIITKILANRLKPILPLIISENQSAFIEGRQISDSILIAHELMHSLKNRRHGKTGWVALKLDMAKAFDRIEWSYLEAVLHKFGFADQWIRWVMSCVSTVSFATVINGEKGDLFSPTRGIRQSCPLSPFLFILCAEGFHYLLQLVVSVGALHGVKIEQFCPSISHLFFADDSVLFWEATASGCHAIDEVLQKYEAASGQLVNRDKSSLFFSPNTPSNVKEGISNFLNIKCEIQGGKYLGLPSIIGKSKTEVFKYVKDQVFHRLQSWKDSTLNMAGKEVLIKSVALTMPNYVMQCFLLPKRVCKDICCAIRKFWWGSKDGENKINWVS